MGRWAETALRIRDRVVPALIGVVGPLGALGTASALLFDRADGGVPDPTIIVIAATAFAVGCLMLWTRWRLLSGYPSDVAVGVLAVIHFLAAAICLRAQLSGGAGGGNLYPAIAGYALIMALLLAWCARVPIRPGGAGDG